MCRPLPLSSHTYNFTGPPRADSSSTTLANSSIARSGFEAKISGHKLRVGTCTMFATRQAPAYRQHRRTCSQSPPVPDHPHLVRSLHRSCTQDQSTRMRRNQTWRTVRTCAAKPQSAKRVRMVWCILVIKIVYYTRQAVCVKGAHGCRAMVFFHTSHPNTALARCTPRSHSFQQPPRDHGG